MGLRPLNKRAANQQEFRYLFLFNPTWDKKVGKVNIYPLLTF